MKCNEGVVLVFLTLGVLRMAKKWQSDMLMGLAHNAVLNRDIHDLRIGRKKEVFEA